MMVHKYDNPPNCNHPPARGIDYCWSYAHHIDGNPGYENVAQLCQGCEFQRDDRIVTAPARLIEAGQRVTRDAAKIKEYKAE